MIRPKLFDRVLTTDELIRIEEETDSTFVNYNVTSGYQFNFNYEKKEQGNNTLQIFQVIIWDTEKN